MIQDTNYTNTYRDTRGAVDGLLFSEVLLSGIASGGGLFVPEIIPSINNNDLQALAALDYPDLAAWVYRAFGVDFCYEHIIALMRQAYGENFDTPQVAPLQTIKPGMHLLELWHGPTFAFKDMALQCLPLFFSASIEKSRGGTGKRDAADDSAAADDLSGASDRSAADGHAAPGDRDAASDRAIADNLSAPGDRDAASDRAAAGKPSPDYLILVATSGDTGKAALEGFANRDHTGIVVFYPHGGVSDIQQLQMSTQTGANVGVYALQGNFDDCQNIVKQLFGSDDFNSRLANEYNIKLSSANSINWGRLLPQIVYYIWAYLQLLNKNEIQSGEQIDICVPTGNFGNILAAWYARAMGVPIDRLICASNDNRVLSDFINSGIYDIRDRDFVLTPSPSMDILVSSNLERQLFELCNRDAALIREWMSDLRSSNRFSINQQTFAALKQCFSAGWVSANESLATIAEVYDQCDYLLDPHTAVAWNVASRLRSDKPVVVAATAHWAKFAADVYRGLAGIAAGAALPDDIAALSGMELAQKIAGCYPHASALPKQLLALALAPVRFRDVVGGSADAAQAAVQDWLVNRRGKQD
jgi:threonine synthase